MLFSRLQAMGLRGVEALRLMRTRTVMVSLIGRTLRVHEGYADAPDHVLAAIVTFATARDRAKRNAARDLILAHDVERAPASRRKEQPRAGDDRAAGRGAEVETDELDGVHKNPGQPRSPGSAWKAVACSFYPPPRHEDCDVTPGW